MKKSHSYPNGIFRASVNNVRKRNGRYVLILELIEEFSGYISIDIHDSICDTAGTSNLSIKLRSRILSNFPGSVKLLNRDGYWKILNEDQILSDAISKSL